MLTILLVHDSPKERESLASTLQSDGFNVVTAADKDSALKTFHEVSPELVVISEGLKSFSAENLCVRIRETGGAAIIVLGKKNNRTKWLELGADAYLVVPVNALELMNYF